MVKNLPSNSGDAGLIPAQGTKIPHATGQLSPRAITTELAHLNKRARVQQTTELTRPGACVPQLQRSNEETARHNERSRGLQLRPDTAKKIRKINK